MMISESWHWAFFAFSLEHIVLMLENDIYIYINLIAHSSENQSPIILITIQMMKLERQTCCMITLV